jgi:hypothetical protein
MRRPCKAAGAIDDDGYHARMVHGYGTMTIEGAQPLAEHHNIVGIASAATAVVASAIYDHPARLRSYELLS